MIRRTASVAAALAAISTAGCLIAGTHTASALRSAGQEETLSPAADLVASAVDTPPAAMNTATTPGTTVTTVRLLEASSDHLEVLTGSASGYSGMALVDAAVSRNGMTVAVFPATGPVPTVTDLAAVRAAFAVRPATQVISPGPLQPAAFTYIGARGQDLTAATGKSLTAAQRSQVVAVRLNLDPIGGLAEPVNRWVRLAAEEGPRP